MTNTIAFALIIGFVVYIVVKGQLQSYLGVIGLGNQVVNGPQSSGSSGGGVSGTLSTLSNLASALGS
jgi:hypothetical protein